MASEDEQKETLVKPKSSALRLRGSIWGKIPVNPVCDAYSDTIEELRSDEGMLPARFALLLKSRLFRAQLGVHSVGMVPTRLFKDILSERVVEFQQKAGGDPLKILSEASIVTAVALVGMPVSKSAGKVPARELCETFTEAVVKVVPLVGKIPSKRFDGIEPSS